jgi:hypothetical protein
MYAPENPQMLPSRRLGAENVTTESRRAIAAPLQKKRPRRSIGLDGGSPNC